MSAKSSRLPTRQVKFVELVLSGESLVDAYLAAGYKSPNRRTATAAASLLYNKPRIKAAIAARQAEIFAKLSINAERVQRERAKIAFFDIRALFDAAGKPKPIAELGEDVAAALSCVDIRVDGDGRVTMRYKLADKNAALTALERMLGLYSPSKAEVTGRGGGAIRGCEGLTPEMAYAQYIEGGPLDVNSLPDEVLERFASGAEILGGP
jgi:phage terminase small subunit